MNDSRTPTSRSRARANSSRVSMNRLQEWSAMPRANLRPDLARNHRLESRRSGPSSACRWRRASLSLPWSCMAAGPSWLSPVGRRSPLQLRPCRRKIRRFPHSPPHLSFNSPLHPSFKWPRRRQHRRKRRPRPKPHRKTPRRQLPQRFPIKHSCCNRWRAILRIWSEPSNSSKRTSNK